MRVTGFNHAGHRFAASSSDAGQNEVALFFPPRKLSNRSRFSTLPTPDILEQQLLLVGRDRLPERFGFKRKCVFHLLVIKLTDAVDTMPVYDIERLTS